MSSTPDFFGPGISLVESVGNWLRGIGLRAGFVPLAWDHDRKPGLIWRIPDASVVSASVFSKVQGVLVREFERAVVLHNGTFYAELESGVYDVRKMPVKDRVDVVWVSTQQTQHKWGVGRVINSENITVGGHGYVFVEVADARQFVLRVVAGSRKYTNQDLEDWIFGIISAVMRTQIAGSTIRDLMQGQEEFVRACGNRLDEAFREWGLAFKNMTVNQFDIPQEYRDTISAVTMAGYEREKTVIDAQAEADALRIRSKAEAERRLTTGGAEVELLAQMAALGLDPVRIKAIEALQQYAQLAATTGGGADSGSDMVQMMMFMQMSRLLADPGMPNDAKEMLRVQFPMEAARVAELPQGQEPEAPTAEPDTDADDSPETQRKRITEVLDNLDERLSQGEISEATYDRLRAKWEQKLEGLDSE